MPKVKKQGTLQRQAKRPAKAPHAHKSKHKDNRGDRIRAYQFQKGQSGNPGGAKKGVQRIKALLDHYAVIGCPAEDMKAIRSRFPGVNQLTLQGAVMLKTYAAALDGEDWALEFLAERTEGKVPQGLQHLIQNPTLNITVADAAGAEALKGLAGNADKI
jgi:hypothetical protein